MVGSQEVLFHQRNRDVCSLCIQRAKQRTIASEPGKVLRTARLKASEWESANAPRKIRKHSGLKQEPGPGRETRGRCLAVETGVACRPRMRPGDTGRARESSVVRITSLFRAER